MPRTNVKTTMPIRQATMIRPAVVTSAPTRRSVTPTRSRVVALIAAKSMRNAAYQQSQKPIAPVIGISRS